MLANRKLDTVLTHQKPDQPHRMFAVSKIKTPDVVDLRRYDIPIWDQGQLGSCTGNGLAAMHDFLRVKILRENSPDKPIDEIIASVKPSSRLFIYYGERAIEGTVNEDAGASIPDGIDVLLNLGVCPERMWPYVESNFKQKPTDACYAEAALHKNVHRFYLDSIEAIEQNLASGYTAVFGIDLYSSFDKIDSDGIMPIPKRGESLEGGHCMEIVGYDRKRQMFIVRQSWGTDYGDHGYIYIPYVVMSSSMVSDCYTVRL